MSKSDLQDGLLPGLPAERISARYAAAPGNELESGKFKSPESSAALAANAFGFFLEKPNLLPPLPAGPDLGWPPLRVEIEEQVRFPWSGGLHPWLDAVVETGKAFIGIESKRYEPYRTKGKTEFSEAYYRPVWGDNMGGYCQVRDDLRTKTLQFDRLDAAQLVKHAFGLRTAVHRENGPNGKTPVLVYLYAEPAAWGEGRPVPPEYFSAHRQEIDVFAKRAAGDEVRFAALSYRDLLDTWRQSDDASVRAHVEAVEAAFKV